MTPSVTAKRHGHEDGWITLWAGAGSRDPLRPQMRSTDEERELALGTYEHFANRDPLTQGCDRPDTGSCLNPPVRRRRRAGRLRMSREEAYGDVGGPSVSEMFGHRAHQGPR